MTASAPVLAAFEAWRLAELASHYAQPCPDDVMNGLVDAASNRAIELANTVAMNADDVLVKLFPLLLSVFEPKIGDPPLLLQQYPDEGPVRMSMFGPLLADLSAHCPQLAAAQLAPHHLSFKRGAAR